MFIFSILNHIRKNFFIYFCGILIIAITWQHGRISSLQLKLKASDTQLASIEQRASEYSLQLARAQKKYQHDIKRAHLNAQRILNSQVSDVCDESMKWAVNQAKYLS